MREGEREGVRRREKSKFEEKPFSSHAKARLTEHNLQKVSADFSRFLRSKLFSISQQIHKNSAYTNYSFN